VELGLVNLSLPILEELSMVIRTWLSFIKPAPLIACSVRTGIIVIQQLSRARLMPWIWLRQLMTALPVYVILVVTLHPNCPMPFVPPDWL